MGYELANKFETTCFELQDMSTAESRYDRRSGGLAVIEDAD